MKHSLCFFYTISTSLYLVDRVSGILFIIYIYIPSLFFPWSLNFSLISTFDHVSCNSSSSFFSFLFYVLVWTHDMFTVLIFSPLLLLFIVLFIHRSLALSTTNATNATQLLPMIHTLSIFFRFVSVLPIKRVLKFLSVDSTFG